MKFRKYCTYYRKYSFPALLRCIMLPTVCFKVSLCLSSYTYFRTIVMQDGESFIFMGSRACYHKESPIYLVTSLKNSMLHSLQLLLAHKRSSAEPEKPHVRASKELLNASNSDFPFLPPLPASRYKS